MTEHADRNGSVTTLENTMPFHRYRPIPAVALSDRTWPDKRIERAPRWLSTDLRDGNQALLVPMSPRRKLKMFELLCRMGYKEIEVGFPAASRDDFDFVRLLIEEDRVPADVRISVLTPARPGLIYQTMQSLIGAHGATVHLYNATSPFFRRVVFGLDRNECIEMAVRGAIHVVRLAEEFLPSCDLGFEYSPEVFTDTEPDFAIEICHKIADIWQPGPGREIILNFPATVERTTPNLFADRIEWIGRHLPYREHTCLSVHPHNDRGTGVAAAELALLAGAERVEGCLFGNGERCGNVCLVTLGMNMFSQGVDPGIDFSDMDEIRRTVEECTGLQVHPRHPYGGELVYTAFSGSHQDAIKKGFDAMGRVAAATGTSVGTLHWEMPYLPIDPKDVGRSYEAIIRVNSQSGKGGVGYIMKSEHGLDLPRGLQVEFAQVVQASADAGQCEITGDQMWSLFDREYMVRKPLATMLTQCRALTRLADIEMELHRVQRSVRNLNIDPAAALAERLRAMGIDITVLESHTHGVAESGKTVVYVRCIVGSPVWGVGMANDAVAASVKAVLSAISRSRLLKEGKTHHDIKGDSSFPFQKNGSITLHRTVSVQRPGRGLGRREVSVAAQE